MCRIIAVNLPLAPRLRGRLFKGRKNNLSFASPSIRCPTKDRGKNLKNGCADAGVMGLYFALLGADTYLKFVMKYRNYRNIINVQNTVKPMVAINVSQLDLDPKLPCPHTWHHHK